MAASVPAPRKKPIKAAKRVVKKIARAINNHEFENEIGFKASMVFEGGSMGQGTTVPHHYDIDLVLYSEEWRLKVSEIVDEQKREAERGRRNGLKEALDEEYCTALTKIDSYLSEKLGRQYTLDEIRGVALKFQYSIPEGGSLSVDLLLSPHFETEEEFFQFLRKVEPPLERLRFSATASKWQTEFIKSQPMRVRELIRRAKFWRNETWKHEDGKSGKPKSYLLSLLVVTAYAKVAQRAQPFKALARQVAKEMVELVRRLGGKQISSLVIPGADTSLCERYADMLPATPRIVDPVNPANNVYLSGVGPDPYEVGDNDWGTFTRKVATIDLTHHPG